MAKGGIVIHGGGVWEGKMRGTAEDYRTRLKEIVELGRSLLVSGVGAVDIAERLVRELEDDPTFKAGRGSISDPAETVTMDASIMDGANGAFGSVTTLRNTRNPVSLARFVMDHRTEKFLIGPGAEEIGRSHNIEYETHAYFCAPGEVEDKPFGTVGAVVCDVNGNLAAASSTGGFPGHNVSEWRVGDTPLIGAGTLADRRCCALSACGHGERFIQHGVVRRIAGMVEFARKPLQSAVETALDEMPKEGDDKVVGGVIGVAPTGDIAFGVTPDFRMACGILNAEGEVRGMIVG